MCMYVVLFHGEVSLVRLRPVWMTITTLLDALTLLVGSSDLKNIVSEMTYTASSGTLHLTQLNSSPEH